MEKNNIEEKTRRKTSGFKKFIQGVWFFLKGGFRSVFLTLTTLSLLFLVVVSGVYVHYANEFQNISPRSSITRNIFLDKSGNKIYESFGKSEPDPVEIDEVPQIIIDATLASEDANFYDHGAVDFRGVSRAAYLNVKSSKKPGILKLSDLFDEESYLQGGSSITQQLVKNLYLTGERSFERKAKEIVYAFEIEKKFSKDEILEMYLNNVYFGQQSLGIKNAAKAYYGKEIDELSLAEVSMLVGLPAAPSDLSPVSGCFDKAKERQKYVLSQMYHEKMITLEEAEEAAAEKLYFGPEKVESFVKHPYFVDYVKKQIKEKIGPEAYDRGGITVQTTLDPKIQAIAEKEARDQVERIKYRNVTNASVIAIDNETGDLRAMVGGIDYEESKFNVTTARRQPGSSFKPIVYLAGLLDEYTASSILWDGYVNFGGTPPYRPRNYDGYFRGNVTVRTALQNSINVPAVQMTSLVGVEKVMETAEKVGIESIDDSIYYGLSIGLGSAEVSLLDLTRAYGTIANLGEKPNATTITKITDAEGETIYIQPKFKEKVLDERVAYIMTNILSDNTSRGQVFGLRSPMWLGDRPVAAKTGTTDSFADSWALGYTPQYTVGVWTGNNDRSVMRNVPGLEGAAPIWNEIMRQVHDGLENKTFEEPEGLEKMWISPYTGRPAIYRGAPNILEYYLPGSEPKPNESFEYLRQFQVSW